MTRRRKPLTRKQRRPQIRHNRRFQTMHKPPEGGFFHFGG